MSKAETREENLKAAYFNRELSWLAFNRRVLEQAEDERYPVLERLRFLAYVSSNLDEFFEIRVAGLIQQVEAGSTKLGMDGLGPKEQLRRVHSVTASLVQDQHRCWHERLVPKLAEAGLVFKTRKDLSRRELAWLKKHFQEQIQPILTPLAIDPAHPYPQFANKALYILLWLDDPDTAAEERMLAFIPVPRILSRIVHIPGRKGSPDSYIFLSDVLKIYAQHLFPGYKIHSAQAFRVTRNSDLYIDEEEVENLLESIEEELHNLRKGAAVRLEIEDSLEEELLDELLLTLRLSKQHVFRINGPINLMRLMSVYDEIDRPDLKFPPMHPFIPEALKAAPFIYDAIRESDHLLHHPYDSFDPVVDFVRHAALDPNVLALKITLYRTSVDSPIIHSLMDAARNKKQVTALIELKARFDEANNINWAKLLEESGVHVVYGFVGLKTHCKCCLVVRREGDVLRRYAHLSSGNYHPMTARHYTDLGLLTAREDITEDVAQIFNTLTGYAKAPTYEKLLVAPYTLHARINEFILREARRARRGKPARIIVKCNSFIDKETINNLYLASQAGVQIDLIVRGICGLVPGVKGLSENIRVRSILGRFLEHSRIFYFENSGGAHPMVWIGSADWMSRNFYRRVEVVFPIEDPVLRERVVSEILEPYLKDTYAAKILRPNGSYRSVSTRKDGNEFSAQENFIEEAAIRTRDQKAMPLTVEAAPIAETDQGHTPTA